MPKVKVPRKSTSVDMTAMCDVAFLLLSFFILTTKFKAPDQLQVTTPKSVSTKAVEAKNVVLVTMDKEGKVYFSVADENPDEKAEVIDLVDQSKALSLTAQEKAAFRRTGAFIGVPFSKLKSYLGLTPDQAKNYKAEGIPVDSANNEMVEWVRAAATAFQGKKMTLLVKGDNDAKYPSFKGVIDALKKNEIFKFSMITDPEGVPPGTELYKKNQASGGKATDE
ncbi:biopolymer transporter ExbD [Paraflavitalea soli]|uniref:Biopolymer transporter ExbD n=1 Tax=Paraflavitalea soli TaxID=2315862 RepID=A0A3B7MQE4_9BACT|nr:biopolymer transporter ExbD [Paraflavitalea soli]AXY76017.1 biopolymer transporter ExbD [Paraflavitalea soli]